MRLKIWLGLILGMIAFSCTKPIELPEVDHDPKLAVFADIYRGGVRAIVSNSVSRNSGPPEYLSDAEVILKNEGGDSYLINFDPSSQIYLLDSIPSIPGETYQLEINHPNFPNVSAITCIPAPISIDSMEVNFIGKRPFNFGVNGTIWSYEFTIYLKEIGTKTPFLSLISSSLMKTIAPDSTVTYSNSSSTNFSGEGIDFSFGSVTLLDTSPQRVIATKSFTFVGEYYIFEENQFLHEVTIDISTVSIEKQQFLSFIDNQTFIGNDLFILDPIEIEGNIENGYGLFEAFTSDSVTKMIE